jgi:hypothetical protein
MCANTTDAAAEAIGVLGLPIGWTNNGFRRSTILGWLVIVLVVSVGRTLWFDFLNRFLNIRASGKAPEKETRSAIEVPPPKISCGSA